VAGTTFEKCLQNPKDDGTMVTTISGISISTTFSGRKLVQSSTFLRNVSDSNSHALSEGLI